MFRRYSARILSNHAEDFQVAHELTMCLEKALLRSEMIMSVLVKMEPASHLLAVVCQSKPY